jgi:hypothetical protein
MSDNSISGGSGRRKLGITPVVCIYLAQGIEGQNKDLKSLPHYADFEQPKYLEDQGLKITTFKSDKNLYKYKNEKLKTIYFIRLVTKKDEFKKWLEEDDAIVVYSGHARFGRGPCFGDSPAPGEDWGDGTISSGIFYMGYRYLGVTASEILTHGYKAWLVPESENVGPKKEIHPWIRKKKYFKMTIGQIIANLKKTKKILAALNKKYHGKMSDDLKEVDSTTPSALRKLVAGNYSPKQKFWCYKTERSYWYKDVHTNKRERIGLGIIAVVLRADWTKTKSDPMDLGATTIKCKVFCHFGCDTLHHSEIIVRDRKGWRYDGQKGYAFMTTASIYEIDPYWLYNLLTGPYKSLDENLRHACQKTNEKLYNLQKEPGNQFEYNYRIKFSHSQKQVHKIIPDLCRACDQKFCKIHYKKKK